MRAWECARSLSNYEGLRHERDAAAATVSDLRYALSRMVATTPEGLAVHVRLLVASQVRTRSTEYEALLLSAAALTGTDLRRPFFDVPEWVAAWERRGGRIERIKRRHGRDEWAHVYPSFAGASDDFRHEVRLLADQRQANAHAVSDWLDANR